MNLPVEIIRLVIRDATCVSAAFDTSFEASISEDIDAVAIAIRESMKTKLALSLVSKCFHEIGVEFLYEIITLRQLGCIKSLVSLLRHKSKPDSPRRGWWCRRLQIAIGEGTGEYFGDTWRWGRYTLWGLIPVCPRLVIFLCMVRFNSGGRYIYFLDGMPRPFRVPPTLFQLLAINCSQTLKRVEIYGHAATRLDQAELLLKACTAMEVFRLSRLREFDNEWHGYGSPNETDPEDVDSEDDNQEPADALDYDALQECRVARTNAKWPTLPIRQKVLLPNLHTLEIFPFNLFPGILSFPALRCVCARLDTRTDSALAMTTLDQGLQDVYLLLTHVRYWGPTNTVWDVLDRFPNAKEFAFGAYPTDAVAGLPPNRHLHLSSIGITWGDTPAATAGFLAAIKRATSEGVFPSLREVRIWRYRDPEIDQVQIDLFARIGLTLEFIQRPHSRYLEFVTFFLVPLVLC